jgi:NAD-dependent dihydropyrimidine dehydrogenase PreA subunit
VEDGEKERAAGLKFLADQKFRNIIVLNGHGGNTTALNRIATVVANRARVRARIAEIATDREGSVAAEEAERAEIEAFLDKQLPAEVDNAFEAVTGDEREKLQKHVINGAECIACAACFKVCPRRRILRD